MNNKVTINCTRLDFDKLFGSGRPTGVTYIPIGMGRVYLTVNTNKCSYKVAKSVADYFNNDGISEELLAPYTDELLCDYAVYNKQVRDLERAIDSYDHSFGDHPDEGPPSWLFQEVTKARKAESKVKSYLNDYTDNYDVSSYYLNSALLTLYGSDMRDKLSLEKQFYRDMYITSIDGDYSRLTKYTSTWDWLAEGNSIPEEEKRLLEPATLNLLGAMTTMVAGLVGIVASLFVVWWLVAICSVLIIVGICVTERNK